METVYGGRVSPSQQIADWLAGRISAGEWGPDEALPSEVTLVQELGVARTTVRRAIRILREQGYVVTIQARGTFVSRRE